MVGTAAIATQAEIFRMSEFCFRSSNAVEAMSIVSKELSIVSTVS